MIVAARSLSYIKPGRVREVSWEPRSRRQQNSHFSTIAELSMLLREITHSIHLCGLQFSWYDGPYMGSRIDVDSRFRIAASPNHYAAGIWILCEIFKQVGDPSTEFIDKLSSGERDELWLPKF